MTRAIHTILIGAGIIVLCSCPVMAEMPADGDTGGDWLELQGQYLNVYFRPDADMKRLEKKIRRRRFYLTEELTSRNPGTQRDRVAYRLDMLFRRTEELLSMYPRRIDLNVKIYKDQADLRAAYKNMFGTIRPVRSFYIHRYQTIYTSEADISDSLMAHEFAHAIVDHYFTVRPPENVKEILSQYVDLHLDD